MAAAERLYRALKQQGPYRLQHVALGNSATQQELLPGRRVELGWYRANGFGSDPVSSARQPHRNEHIRERQRG